MLLRLLSFMTFLLIKACFSLTLTGSADFAVLRQTFRFTCTVANENETTFGSVSFLKFDEVPSCSVLVSSCSQNGGSTDYSCGCVSGQRDVYYMNISRVSVQKDEGTWRCQHRSERSNKFTLPVYYPASITSFTINSNTDTVTVSESDHVIMRCQMDSYPGSIIRLLNGSSELSRADNSLTVEYTWTTDCRQRGKYECVASNNISSVTKSVRLITTCLPKREVTSRQEQKAAVGDDTTLSLTIISYPEPVISWFKTNSYRNLTSISSVSRVSDVSVTASLTLTGVQQQDFGEYIVQADNGVEQIVNISIKLVSQGAVYSAGMIGGVIFGVFVLIAIILISAIVLYRRKKRVTDDDKKHMTVVEANGSNHGFESESSEPKRIITGGDQYTVVTKKDDKLVCAELQSKKTKDRNEGVDGQRNQSVNNGANSRAKSGVDAAVCKYIDVEIMPSGTKPVIKYQEEKTEYADIKPGVYAPPLPEEEDENDVS